MIMVHKNWPPSPDACDRKRMRRILSSLSKSAMYLIRTVPVKHEPRIVNEIYGGLRQKTANRMHAASFLRSIPAEA